MGVIYPPFFLSSITLQPFADEGYTKEELKMANETQKIV